MALGCVTFRAQFRPTHPTQGGLGAPQKKGEKERKKRGKRKKKKEGKQNEKKREEKVIYLGRRQCRIFIGLC